MTPLVPVVPAGSAVHVLVRAGDPPDEQVDRPAPRHVPRQGEPGEHARHGLDPTERLHPSSSLPHRYAGVLAAWPLILA